MAPFTIIAHRFLMHIGVTVNALRFIFILAKFQRLMAHPAIEFPMHSGQWKPGGIMFKGIILQVEFPALSSVTLVATDIEIFAVR